MSWALGTSKLSWSIYAKEMLAIIEAIRIWRPYLLGRKFYIQMDKCSLKYLLEQHVVTPEQQKWVAKLLGMTPFQALYGRLPPTILQYQVGNSLVNEVDQNLASRDALLGQLKDNLHAASNHMKQVVDSKWCDIEFEEGDMVFLKLHPYWQQTVFKRAYQKLASRFYVPYLIEKQVGKVAYRLQLPEGSRIHPIFHVSLLKKKVGEAYATSKDLPPLTDEGEFIMAPEAILDSRWVKKGSKFIEESLVKWRRLPVKEATWENIAALRDKFQAMDLEDKDLVNEGSIDRPRRSGRTVRKNPKYMG
ncbi:hypothetical protein F0562_007344 [Nyssa sinensis]|uniref:Chromo domain-containing protein n=1 Tax=Nyssa sinensis TaxID=561372 RepID=A0A5J5A534_9ASTE|nr:hypothetical protein F0562_007344 [Nyssa sinensis]